MRSVVLTFASTEALNSSRVVTTLRWPSDVATISPVLFFTLSSTYMYVRKREEDSNSVIFDGLGHPPCNPTSASTLHRYNLHVYKSVLIHTSKMLSTLKLVKVKLSGI